MKIEDRGSRGRKKVRETVGQWNSDSAQCSTQWCQGGVVPVGGASGDCGWRGESDKRVLAGRPASRRWCGF